MGCIYIYEYLRRIGHSAFSGSADPKITVMKIWLYGGFVEVDYPHRPHYINREFKKRYMGEPLENITHIVDIMKR